MNIIISPKHTQTLKALCASIDAEQDGAVDALINFLRLEEFPILEYPILHGSKAALVGTYFAHGFTNAIEEAFTSELYRDFPDAFHRLCAALTCYSASIAAVVEYKKTVFDGVTLIGDTSEYEADGVEEAMQRAGATSGLLLHSSQFLRGIYNLSL